MVKRKVLLSLAVVLLLPVLGFSTGQQEAEVQQGPVTVTVFRSNGEKIPDAANDILRQELIERINVDVDMFATNNEYEKQLNVRIASGDLPDVFDIPNKAFYEQFARDGILLNISKYGDKLSNYMKWPPEDRLKLTEIDGSMYGFTSPYGVNMASYWVRKDWLDEVGLAIPRTLEDYIAVCEAFTNSDPDGNGKQDTYGLTGLGIDAFTGFFGAYGLPLPEYIFVENGKMQAALFHPRMEEALTTIRSVIRKGIVDPGIMTNKGYQHFQKMVQQQAGMGYQWWWQMLKPDWKSQIDEVNSNAEWVAIDPPSGKNGSNNHFVSVGIGGVTAISGFLEDTPSKLDAALRLMDYTSSEEGLKLVMYGLEGEHYTVDAEGNINPTQKLVEVGGYFSAYQLTGRMGLLYLRTKFPYAHTEIELAYEAPHMTIYNDLFSIPEGYNPADTKRYIEEELLKFLYDQRPLSEYHQFLKELETKFKYRLYLDNAEKELRSRGFVD